MFLINHLSMVYFSYSHAIILIILAVLVQISFPRFVKAAMAWGVIYDHLIQDVLSSLPGTHVVEGAEGSSSNHPVLGDFRALDFEI